MKQIQKFIKNKLGSNADLLNTELIDKTLSLSEQKEDLIKYIYPLMPMEDKLKELIQGQQMFIPKTKRDIWKEIRGCWN